LCFSEVLKRRVNVQYDKHAIKLIIMKPIKKLIRVSCNGMDCDPTPRAKATRLKMLERNDPASNFEK